MPDIEVTPDPDEIIVRVFFRYDNEKDILFKLVGRNFARQMRNHSGISMLRLKYLSRQQAINWVPTARKLKGLAVCSAGRLLAMGFKFVASSTADPHLSARCPPCNMCVNYQELCTTTGGDECTLDLYSEGILCPILAELFTIDTPIDLSSSPVRRR